MGRGEGTRTPGRIFTNSIDRLPIKWGTFEDIPSSAPYGLWRRRPRRRSPRRPPRRGWLRRRPRRGTRPPRRVRRISAAGPRAQFCGSAARARHESGPLGSHWVRGILRRILWRILAAAPRGAGGGRGGREGGGATTRARHRTGAHPPIPSPARGARRLSCRLRLRAPTESLTALSAARRWNRPRKPIRGSRPRARETATRRRPGACARRSDTHFLRPIRCLGDRRRTKK